MSSLHIHEMSLETVDDLISNIWSHLSEEEKKAFTDELASTDEEYIHDIQELIKQTKNIE